MKLCAGMLTFNHIKTGREGMFHHALESLLNGLDPEGCDPVSELSCIKVVTNGSTDGTQDKVRMLGGIVDDTNSQIWYGMELAINWCIEQGADIVLFTADDIVYREGWVDKLLAFWEDAPDEVKLCSLILEPQYPWNVVRGTLEAGGQRAILRDSVGGCSWSFRAKDWPTIGPLEQIFPGEDLAACKKLIDGGYHIAQIDLGDHIGEAHSAWGNQSHLYAVPLDRERWGI